MKQKKNKGSGEQKQVKKLPIQLEVPKTRNIIFEKLLKPFLYCGGNNGK